MNYLIILARNQIEFVHINMLTFADLAIYP